MWWWKLQLETLSIEQLRSNTTYVALMYELRVGWLAWKPDYTGAEAVFKLLKDTTAADRDRVRLGNISLLPLMDWRTGRRCTLTVNHDQEKDATWSLGELCLAFSKHKTMYPDELPLIHVCGGRLEIAGWLISKQV
jgi:hypothetical protein